MTPLYGPGMSESQSEGAVQFALKHAVSPTGTAGPSNKPVIFARGPSQKPVLVKHQAPVRMANDIESAFSTGVFFGAGELPPPAGTGDDWPTQQQKLTAYATAKKEIGKLDQKMKDSWVTRSRSQSDWVKSYVRQSKSAAFNPVTSPSPPPANMILSSHQSIQASNNANAKEASVVDMEMDSDDNGTPLASTSQAQVGEQVSLKVSGKRKAIGKEGNAKRKKQS